MPRVTLPDAIERNDKQPETDAEKEVVGQLPNLWDQHDTISGMADQTDWSRSLVGRVYRDFFEPVGDDTDEPEEADDSHERLVTINVCDIPDDPEAQQAFLRGIKAVVK